MIKIGEQYIHKGTRDVYTVVDFCRVKVNGEWYDGVVYHDSRLYPSYVRTEEDFLKSFEEV